MVFTLGEFIAVLLLVVSRVLTLLKLLIMETYIPLFCACYVGVFIILLIYGLAGPAREGKPGIWPLLNVWTTAFFIFSLIVTVRTFF